MPSLAAQRQQLCGGKYGRFNRSTSVTGVVEQTYASFVNKSNESLRFIWLDWNGTPKLYATVKPGGDYRVFTYSTHTWVVEDGLGNIWASHTYGAPTLALPPAHMSTDTACHVRSHRPRSLKMLQVLRLRAHARLCICSMRAVAARFACISGPKNPISLLHLKLVMIPLAAISRWSIATWHQSWCTIVYGLTCNVPQTAIAHSSEASNWHGHQLHAAPSNSPDQA